MACLPHLVGPDDRHMAGRHGGIETPDSRHGITEQDSWFFLPLAGMQDAAGHDLQRA